MANTDETAFDERCAAILAKLRRGYGRCEICVELGVGSRWLLQLMADDIDFADHVWTIEGARADRAERLVHEILDAEGMPPLVRLRAVNLFLSRFERKRSSDANRAASVAPKARGISIDARSPYRGPAHSDETIRAWAAEISAALAGDGPTGAEPVSADMATGPERGGWGRAGAAGHPQARGTSRPLGAAGCAGSTPATRDARPAEDETAPAEPPDEPSEPNASTRPPSRKMRRALAAHRRRAEFRA